MLLSLLLPLLKINFWQPAAETNQAIRILQAVSAGDEYMENIVLTAKRSNWSVEQLYPIVYILISLIFFFVMLRTLILIRTLLKKYPVQRVENIAFVNTEDDSTPFSFLKYIFWNSSIDIDTITGRQIFKHEVAHIQEKHTHDKLFVNIILIFCWCNPFFWLYRKELNMIHEFIADKKAVEDSDTAAFAAMILQAAYPRHQFQLTNNFFYSPIKRRLMMLTKNKNPKVNYIGRIMVLPLAVLIFAAFTFKAKKYTSIYNGEKITVVIDAGHGGSDLGAKSADGILEKDLTLAIAKKVQELNSNDAIEIVLVRDGDVFMSPQQKVEFAKSKNADLVISFHVDNGPKESANTKTGMAVFVAKDEFANAVESKVLASVIINEFSNNYGLAIKPQPNQYQRGIWILQANTCPAVLIEAGFINNDKDMDYLQTSAAKETIAKNVLAAIEKFAYSTVFNKSKQNKIYKNDTFPTGMFVNVKHADSTYLKSDDFKNKAFVIIDSDEIGNVGNNYVERSGKNYSSVVVYNSKEAVTKFGSKGKYGVIKLTQKDVMFITADAAHFDEQTKSIKLTGDTPSLKGDFSNSLIYLDDKIISPQALNQIDPSKISSINILKGDKIKDIVDAKGKNSVIYISSKADDLPEVIVVSKTKGAEPHIVLNTKLNNNNTLYIGIDNPIAFVSSIDKNELHWKISKGNLELKNGELYAKVTSFGKISITISKRNGTMTPQSFQFEVARVPDPDEPYFPSGLKLNNTVEPKIFLGKFRGGKISIDDLRAQKEIRVTQGYSFLSADIWFRYSESNSVINVKLNSSSLSSIEDILNGCKHGSTFIFDNVYLLDNMGNKKLVMLPPAFSVYDPEQIKYSINTKEAAVSKAIQDEKEKQSKEANIIFTKTEVEPQFTGGQDAWRKYLRENLKAITPVDEGWKAGVYKVVVKFIVHTDGTVSDVTTEDYAGTKTALHCIDVIKNAPKWQPAIQNGRKVNAYKKQPITFVIEE